ncbi:MAG: pyrimidine 5'-nucleotidase [Fibrobacter sp.]|nr:pyrimidine 5'-nucleotidase [Fibrobacter sp.]
MIWLFDYDLTLYGADEHCVLDSLDRRISLSVQNATGVDSETAHKIRKDYLARFGTTLAGLQALHGVQPDDFFDFIHQPQYLTYPKHSPQKRELLMGLGGHRYVFTNGRRDWSEAGMNHMGIRDCIEDVFDLKQMDWVGKPHEIAYEKLELWLAEKLPNQFTPEGLPTDPSRIVLLEDSVRNLEPAYRRGWKTVLVNPLADVPDWVDFHIPDLMCLESVLPELSVL